MSVDVTDGNDVVSLWKLNLLLQSYREALVFEIIRFTDGLLRIIIIIGWRWSQMLSVWLNRRSKILNGITRSNGASFLNTGINVSSCTEFVTYLDGNGLV